MREVTCEDQEREEYSLYNCNSIFYIEWHFLEKLVDVPTDVSQQWKGKIIEDFNFPSATVLT
jgi:hypothetical protein